MQENRQTTPKISQPSTPKTSETHMDGCIDIAPMQENEQITPTASQCKNIKKHVALAEINTNTEESADVEGNTGEKPKRRKRNNKTKEKKNEETGVILDLAEFDEAQKTTIAEEMRRDLKKIVENNIKIEKSMEIMQRSMKEMIEKE